MLFGMSVDFCRLCASASSLTATSGRPCACPAHKPGHQKYYMPFREMSLRLCGYGTVPTAWQKHAMMAFQGVSRLPLPVTKLRSIFHFRVGAHSLPVEQGRIEMPKVPRHLRRCTFCAANAIGDERHCVFDCPHFQGLRQQHAMIFRDSHDAMRSVMWHKDQKSVCALVLAIVNEAQTL